MKALKTFKVAQGKKKKKKKLYSTPLFWVAQGGPQEFWLAQGAHKKAILWNECVLPLPHIFIFGVRLYVFFMLCTFTICHSIVLQGQ